MYYQQGQDNMSFFRNFPTVAYNFGNETFDTTFHNLTTYIDLIDQIADDASFYEKYYIQDGQRPDVLSYELYGTSDFYWTFFLLNSDLRKQGWPMSSLEVYDAAKLYYPNRVINTTSRMHGEFYIGDIVADRSDLDEFGTGFKAKILEKNYDLGQLTVKPIIDVKSITLTNGGNGYTSPPTVTISGGGGKGATAQAIMTYLDGDTIITSQTIQSIAVLTGGEEFTSAPTVTISEPNIANGTQATATAQISSFTLPRNTTIFSQPNQPNVLLWDDDLVRSLITSDSTLQYNAAAYYTDTNQNIVDLNINVGGGVDNQVGQLNKIPVTYLDRLIATNNELRNINIFTPSVAAQVSSEFQKLLRS
jgi:hypothetical protein